MNAFGDVLDEIAALAAGLVSGAVAEGGLRAATDHEVGEVLAAAGRVQRLIETVLVDAVGEADARSATHLGEDRLAVKLGCHDVTELIERTTLCSRASASRLRKAAAAVKPEVIATTGELREPDMPAVREAMLDGFVGVDGILAIAAPLRDVRSRVLRAARHEAEKAVAAAARGEGPDQGVPLSADLLRVQAQVWALALDQDGAEPRERRQLHRRGVTLGAATESGVPIRGTLLPEVAAQFQRLCDAMLSPRVQFTPDPDSYFDGEAQDPDGISLPRDTRSPAQKRHDVLATALTIAAASGELPTVGGAAPTLVVSVREEDLRTGRGAGHADGIGTPIPISFARQVGCTGVIQRVTLSDEGRIVSISTQQRVFNQHQRRAIALRDGGCLIPGCGVPATWCEVHHVTEHAHGGPTHTDNGVLLCWWHHRYLERSGWQIRMNGGVPEIYAPSWCDPRPRWRRLTSSPTRIRDRLRPQRPPGQPRSDHAPAPPGHAIPLRT